MSWEAMHRPGDWSVLTETSNGRTYLGADEAHCREVFVIRQLQPRTGRVEAVGAVLLDPSGARVDAWGVDVPTDGSPDLFERLRHLTEDQWRDCRTCGRLLSVGQLVSLSGNCSMCTYNRDTIERPVRFDEAEETVPRPGECSVCRRRRVRNVQVKKGQVYLPEVGEWHCHDHAAETRQRIARERYSRT